VICRIRDVVDAFADRMVGVAVGKEKLDECVLFVDRDAASHGEHRVTAKSPPSHPLIWGCGPSRGCGPREGRGEFAATVTSMGIIDRDYAVNCTKLENCAT
jgi:hypothetical protein